MIGRSLCGTIHGGVRMNTLRLETSGWMLGTVWTAEAPVPMTATRSPVTSWSSSQAAVWNAAPLKLSSPGMDGIEGSDRPPTPATTTCAVSSPWLVCSRQWPASSSQSAPVTSLLKRT